MAAIYCFAWPIEPTTWWNWKTRDAQTVEPISGIGSSNLPVVTYELQARQVPNRLP